MGSVNPSVSARSGAEVRALLKARPAQPITGQWQCSVPTRQRGRPAFGGLSSSVCFVFQTCRSQLLPVKDSCPSEPAQRPTATMIFCILLLASLPEPSGAEVNPGRELPDWPPISQFPCLHSQPFFAFQDKHV